MSKQIQAKHIADTEFLALVANAQLANGGHRVFWWDINPYFELHGFPWGVVVAKARSLIKRGLLGGCVHNGKGQCRGDLEVTDLGREALRDYMTKALAAPRRSLASIAGGGNG